MVNIDEMLEKHLQVVVVTFDHAPVLATGLKSTQQLFCNLFSGF
jgi:hypothetical protein